MMEKHEDGELIKVEPNANNFSLEFKPLKSK